MTVWPPIVACWYKQLILRGDERNYVATVVVCRYKKLILGGEMNDYVATNSGISGALRTGSRLEILQFKIIFNIVFLSDR